MKYSSKLKAALKMIQNGQRLSKQEFRKEKKKKQTKTYLVDSDIKQSRRLNTLLKKKGMELISWGHKYKKESNKTLERF